MNNQYTVIDALEEHRRLYQYVLDESASVTSDSFRVDVDDLLKQIVQLMGTTTSLGEYRKLKDIAVKWQMVYLSLFNTSEIIKIPSPSTTLLPSFNQGDTVMSADSISEWINKFAYFRAFFHGKGGVEEEKEDYHHAELMFASEVLDGHLNMLRMGAAAYPRLESIWLREVKQLRAYFLWKDRRGEGHGHDKEDYENACEHLREMLVEVNIKASPADFRTPKKYIEDMYLMNGKIDNKKAYGIIKRKARWASKRSNEGCRDDALPIDDWVEAETYVLMFYENIVGAVLDKDENKTLSVLRAFQYGKVKGGQHHVINCFEAALAIYFLDEGVIRDLWDRYADEPCIDDSCVEVKVRGAMPHIIKFNSDDDIECALAHKVAIGQNEISFKGVMSDADRNALFRIMARANADTNKVSEVIDSLYHKSRIIHKTNTF